MNLVTTASLKPWARVDAARAHVISVIGEPFWGGLESTLRVASNAATFDRETAKLLSAKKEMTEARVRLVRALSFVEQSVGAVRTGLKFIKVRKEALAGLDGLEAHVDDLLVGGPHRDLPRGFASLDAVVQKNIAQRAEPFRKLRSKKDAWDAAQRLVVRATMSDARRWRRDAREEGRALRPRLTGALFAIASIAARVEPPCPNETVFHARRVRWTRAMGASR